MVTASFNKANTSLTMLRGLLEVLVVVVVAFAWVTGQLDPLQKKLQEVLLDVMGETKMSYGIKSE